jgi:hypothetical protein
LHQGKITIMVNNLAAHSLPAMEFNGFPSREAHGGPDYPDYPTPVSETYRTHRDRRDQDLAAIQQPTNTTGSSSTRFDEAVVHDHPESGASPESDPADPDAR